MKAASKHWHDQDEDTAKGVFSEFQFHFISVSLQASNDVSPGRRRSKLLRCWLAGGQTLLQVSDAEAACRCFLHFSLWHSADQVSDLKLFGLNCCDVFWSERWSLPWFGVFLVFMAFACFASCLVVCWTVGQQHSTRSRRHVRCWQLFQRNQWMLMLHVMWQHLVDGSSTSSGVAGRQICFNMVAAQRYE